MGKVGRIKKNQCRAKGLQKGEIWEFWGVIMLRLSSWGAGGCGLKMKVRSAPKPCAAANQTRPGPCLR